MRHITRPIPRGMYLWILVCAGSACDPAHWRYLTTLTPVAVPTNLPDGNAIALGDTTQDSPPPAAAVGKFGSQPAVDLFQFNGGTWSFDRRLGPRPGAKGNFGEAVALSADTLAIGAHHDDPQKVENGYVDLYVRQGQAWQFQQAVTVTSFTPPPLTSGSAEFGFGRALDLAGEDLVVGAGRFAGGYGRVFVFHREAGKYTQVAELKEADPDQRFDANFGDTVKIYGDTIIATRPDTPASTPPPKAGKVYIYARAGGTWALQQVLQSPTATGAYDGFGNAAALWGDQLAIRKTGMVYVYTRSAGVWSQAWSVAVGSGEVNSVDINDDHLAIGEPAEAANGYQHAGQIRIFLGLGNTYNLQALRNEPAPGKDHFFGARVALRGNQVLVGAPGSAGGSGAYSATLSYLDGPY